MKVSNIEMLRKILSTSVEPHFSVDIKTTSSFVGLEVEPDRTFACVSNWHLFDERIWNSIRCLLAEEITISYPAGASGTIISDTIGVDTMLKCFDRALRMRVPKIDDLANSLENTIANRYGDESGDISVTHAEIEAEITTIVDSANRQLTSFLLNGGFTDNGSVADYLIDILVERLQCDDIEDIVKWANGEDEDD